MAFVYLNYVRTKLLLRASMSIYYKKMTLHCAALLSISNNNILVSIANCRLSEPTYD